MSVPCSAASADLDISCFVPIAFLFSFIIMMYSCLSYAQDRAPEAEWIMYQLNLAGGDEQRKAETLAAILKVRTACRHISAAQ